MDGSNIEQVEARMTKKKTANRFMIWFLVGIITLVIGIFVPPLLLISLPSLIVSFVIYFRYAKKRVDAGEVTWSGEKLNQPTSDQVIYPIDNNRIKKAIQRNLRPDEEIKVQMTAGSGQTLVATTERLFIIKAGFLAGATFGAKVTQFNYRTITSIEVRFDLMTGIFEVSTGGMQGVERGYYGAGRNGAYAAPNCIPLTRGDRERFERAANVIQDLIAERNGSQQSVVAPAAVTDNIDQIRKLAELRDDGIISSEEFESKKSVLLNSIGNNNAPGV